MLKRPEALRLIDAAFPAHPIVLTLGGTIREMLATVGRRARHLYSLDAMGQTLSLGLGLALGLEDRDRPDKVIVVEGDGSLLMGFSALTTAGHLKPRKLVLIVLDNGVYLATGGQPTISREIDYVTVARACGWPHAREVPSTRDDLASALRWAQAVEGPLLLRVPVTAEQIPTDYFLEDPAVLAHEFRAWLAPQNRAGATPG